MRGGSIPTRYSGRCPRLAWLLKAFFVTVELGGSSTRTARIIASAVSIVLNLITIELMARHRRACVYYARWIADYEREHLKCVNAHPHAFNAGSNPAGGPLAGHSSWQVWIWSLPAMGLASVAVIVIASARPGVLEIHGSTWLARLHERTQQFASLMANKASRSTLASSWLRRMGKLPSCRGDLRDATAQLRWADPAKPQETSNENVAAPGSLPLGAGLSSLHFFTALASSP